MRRFNTLRVRLVLWSMLVNTVLLIALGGVVWWGLRQVLSTQIDNTLQLSASQLTSVVDSTNDQLTVSPDDAALLTNRGVFAWIVDSSGQVDTAIGRANQLALPNLSHNLQEFPLDQDHRMRIYRQQIGEATGASVIVGVSLDSLEQTSQAVLLILVIAIPIVLFLSAAGAAFLAGRALQPIAAITAQAQRISRENLTERLTFTTLDEVGRLAQTFDDMLDRLQAAFEHEQHFIADASHELRTPLGILKAQLSLALSRPRSVEALTQMMSAMDGDVDRMTRLVEQLLVLIRTESTAINFFPVDVSDLLSGLVSQLQPLATEREIVLSLETPSQALIAGDRDLLVQVFLNLIDNAIKYAPVQSQVNIRVCPADRYWQINILDAGPGISPEHLAHLFDRFYRIDPSRTRHTGGTGLGLSIAQAIIRQHQGQISVQSEVGRGSTFTVLVPKIT